jgi:signal transduction histidine kinase
MSSSAATKPQLSTPAQTAHDRRTRLVPSEFAFLRFVAGMRALLAVLVATGLLAQSGVRLSVVALVIVPYSWWAAVLLWKTLRGWPRAASKLWLWLDAGVVLLVSQVMAQPAPLRGALAVLPVVALALLAGARHATPLALTCAGVLLYASWHHGAGSLPALLSSPIGVPIILLALGPAAALLAHPSRELRQRLQLLDAFNARSDPRQGLRHHVDVLLELIGRQYELSAAVISVQGPEPRIFQWRPESPAQVMAEPDMQVWSERLAQLPHDMGCHCNSSENGVRYGSVALGAHAGVNGQIGDAVRGALLAMGPQTLTLPLMSYGQPSGHLCLSRESAAFTEADFRWLDGVMRESLPLLERSDLLEQLQRETESRERERIGRDLHDSAVQPYLGLKYGLEALSRHAGPHNPISANIQQLLKLATEELQTLRDVVSGLRSGNDPSSGSASLVALQRQVERFQSLYGLKVHVFAPQAPHLRGSAAKAMLHMVNEALTNVRRHTSATAVTVLLDVHQTDVVLRLRNDHGPDELLTPGFVPRSLTERAAEFGGTVDVTHEPDFTEIAITLPLIGAVG